MKSHLWKIEVPVSNAEESGLKISELQNDCGINTEWFNNWLVDEFSTWLF